MAIIKYNNYLIGRGYNVDYDTEAFLYVVRPYDLTNNITAVDTFVKSYKAAHGVNRLVDIGDTAIYLMYGGTETACCLNLINPSLSNPYNLVKVGTPTFDASGITFDRSSYMRTNILPASTEILNNSALMGYVRNNVAANTTITGVQEDVTGCSYLLQPRRSDNRILFDSYNATAGAGRLFPTTPTSTDCRGLTIGNRQSSTVSQFWKRGSKVYSISTSGGALSIAKELYVGTFNNNGVPGTLSTYNLAFVAITRGKTDAQCIAITNAVNQLQTDLGRAV